MININISDHFISRIKERAPWMINVDQLSWALQNKRKVFRRKTSVITLMNNNYKEAEYYLVPKLNVKKPAVILVFVDKKLVTLYVAIESDWEYS